MCQESMSYAAQDAILTYNHYEKFKITFKGSIRNDINGRNKHEISICLSEYELSQLSFQLVRASTLQKTVEEKVSKWYDEYLGKLGFGKTYEEVRAADPCRKFFTIS